MAFAAHNINLSLSIKASNYPRERSIIPQDMDTTDSLGNTGQKRSFSQTRMLMPSPPPSKRTRLACSSASPTKDNNEPPPNQIYGRVILRDYERSVCAASSLIAFLTTLEAFIEGLEAIYKAGFLHKDISINNLINEDEKNPLCSTSLNDLDLATKEDRKGSSLVKRKTGTRVFMPIGVLLWTEPHSFMHDLESFFWVLHWICIHYNEPGKDIGSTGSTGFENWKYMDDRDLGIMKTGRIANLDFLPHAEEQFTPYYRPLVRWVAKLRMVVFPNCQRWRNEYATNPKLYSSIKKILREAREDLEVADIRP
ncbi:serine/threonine-protein kinase Sgk2 [Sclerotinia borealis F-4128]|uniref:Serine/threonine-protein kinase Sgk2 n=1 Tax=Sclerotinia borealis (strain F-4128) TaxID=1432307 RepID=W9CC76_SCLBF|nr:serine/threonine-protein kinase Sgk2 [Sclerotinia borealis F-4128]